MAAASTAWKGFRDADARRNDPLPIPSPTPAVSARPDAARLLWTRTTLGGASLDCPFLLEALNSQNAFSSDESASIQRFAGGIQNCRVIFWHASYPFFQGQITPERFRQMIYAIAPDYDFGLSFMKSATNTVNGMQAKRVDSNRANSTAPTFGRMMIFTRENQAWFLFVDSPANFGEGEQVFQRMALSLRPE